MKKRILVTGAGSGFGRDCVLGLAGRGHEVIAAVHHPDEIAQIHDEASARGVSLRAEKLDLAEADRQAAFAWDVDVLVNNAAIGQGARSQRSRWSWSAGFSMSTCSRRSR